jgi:hypothetical protein
LTNPEEIRQRAEEPGAQPEQKSNFDKRVSRETAEGAKARGVRTRSAH